MSLSSLSRRFFIFIFCSIFECDEANRGVD
jgi:hypothetical protein